MKTKEEREEIIAALHAIAEKNGGVLRAEDVVEAAKDPSSPLHASGYFTWDLKTAAYERWVDQARTLIRSVRVEIKTEKTTISTVCYVRNPDAESDEQGYVQTATLIGDKDRAHIALVEEFKRAAAALRRARELAIAFGMADEIDAIAESVQIVRTKVEAHVEHRTPQ